MRRDYANSSAIIADLDLKEWRRDLLANALAGEATHTPDEVCIGTIHAAKGLEAKAVLLFPGYTQKMLDRYYYGNEPEERRLFYVGATRAKEELDIAKNFFNGPTFPPLV